MSRPTQPLDLAGKISQLEQRIARLERANPLEYSTIVDGALRVRDSTGQTRAQIGNLSTWGFGFGILVLDENSNIRLLVEDDGMDNPYMHMPIVGRDTFEVVTSGTFVDTTWWSQAEIISSKGMTMWVSASADAGTTGEIRIRNTALATNTSAVAVPDGDFVHKQFLWLHGSGLSTGPVGFRVQARRTSGTGNVNVYSPWGSALIRPAICTADGLG